MNRRQRNGSIIVFAIIGAWLLWVFMRRRSSMGYRTITTNMDDTAPDMFKNQPNLKCVPGPGPDAAYYTDSTGGGLCGDQPYVQTLGHGYSISDGVGGGLLSM